MAKKKEIKSTKTQAKKRPVGRPTKYKPEYCQDIIEFFESHPLTITKVKTIRHKDGSVEEEEYEAPGKPPLLYRYAQKLGVTRDTLHEWGTQHPDFSDALKKAKDIQAGFIVDNAMTDIGPTTFSIFMMKNNHNWSDRVEQKVETKMSLENLVGRSFEDNE